MRAWRPPGRLRAPCGRPRLLGGLLAALGPSWPLLGLSWPSRGAPGGSRGASGRSFLFFFGGRRRDPEISCFLMILYFSIIFLKSFLTIGCRPCGKAGTSAHLENTRFRSEGMSNLAFRPLACTANNAETSGAQAKLMYRVAGGR